jgi:hypothetical protein
MSKAQFLLLAFAVSFAPVARAASLTCTDNNVAHTVSVQTFDFGVTTPIFTGPTGTTVGAPISSVTVSFPLSPFYVDFYQLAIAGQKLSSCVLNASTGTSPTLQVTMQNVIFSSLTAGSRDLSTTPATSSTVVNLGLSFQSAAVRVSQ